LILPLLFAVAGCTRDHEHRGMLESLVRRGADQQEAIRQLGGGVTVHERGTPSWIDLQQFLDREEPTAYRPLRDAMTKYPRILYHTTAWRMTWIFVDERGAVRDFYLTSQ
jgi:hypothetical protein